MDHYNITNYIYLHFKWDVGNQECGYGRTTNIWKDVWRDASELSTAASRECCAYDMKS